MYQVVLTLSFGPLDRYNPILVLSSLGVEYRKVAIELAVAGDGIIPRRSTSAIHSLSFDRSLNAFAAFAIRLLMNTMEVK